MPGLISMRIIIGCGKNRQSAGSEWTGFDVELAETFAEHTGVTLELKEIGWNDKTRLLEKREIDCIRNGMTMTSVLTESISCSMPYLSNVQVVVMYEEKLKQYKTIEECQHLLFAVAAGSTGELFRKEKYRYVTCSIQKEALRSVPDKKADAFIQAAYEDGSISALAEKYGIENAVLE